MRIETFTFGTCAFFFVLVAPAYWFIAEDPTGTSALVMTALLALLVTFYLGFHASKMEARPEDLKEAEIADGAGELGFFPPYSWWPLWCALCGSVVFVGLALTLWWLAIIGAGLGVLATSGLVFQYYTGEHAH